MLASVSGGAPDLPIVIGSMRELVPLAATLADLQGLGVTVLPCAAAAGLLLVVDGSGLLVSDGGAEIVSARHAKIHSTTAAVGRPGRLFLYGGEPRVPPRGAVVFDRDAARCGGLGGRGHTMSGEPDPNTPLRLTVGALRMVIGDIAQATKAHVIEEIAKAVAPLEGRIAELESREYQGGGPAIKPTPQARR